MVKVCKFCGCECFSPPPTWAASLEGDTVMLKAKPDQPPSYVIDAPEFPIKAVFKICHCPCHWDDKTMEVHLKAIREIFPDLVLVGG